MALVFILLVISATNANSERTFSENLFKEYYDSDENEHLITLHVHKERTEALDLKAIANEFTARNEC